MNAAKLVTLESLENYEEARFISDGDLLWNSTGTGTIGRIILVCNPPAKLVCDSHVTVVRCLVVLPEYIRTWLRSDSVYSLIEDRAAGSTNQVELTAQMAINQIVPLPPLAEQRRIVAKVDELMALCDRLEAARAEREVARNRLAAASLARLNAPDPETFHDDARFALAALPAATTRPDQIKRLRQTILNLAVRGKLVRQNANDEPAPDLLRRLQKDGLGSDAGLLSDGIQVDDFPLGWARVELSSIANVGTGLTPSRVRPEYFDPPIIPWVTSGETSESSISTTAQHISPLALKETGLRVYPPGTLLVAMYGQGKTRGQVAELKIAAATNQACAAIVLLLDDRGHRRYIKLFFEKIYEEIRALSAGGAQPNLNVGKIKSTTIPFPPLEEQRRIVAKVDELMALCDRLEASLSTGEDHRRRLLEALLQQALQPADTLAAAA